MTCDFRGKQHARCLTHVFCHFHVAERPRFDGMSSKEEDAEVKAIGGKMDSCRHSIRCIDAILVGLHASRVKRMNNFVFFARCAPVPRPLSSPNLFQF